MEENPIIIERIFDAPRELVWKMWTEPEHFKRWWGPRNFTCPVFEMDVRVGGKYFWCMSSPEFGDGYSIGEYLEVIPPEKLVFSISFADKDRNIVSPVIYGFPEGSPDVSSMIVELEDLGGKTKMRLTDFGDIVGEMRDMSIAGWHESFDKMSEVLQSIT